MAEQHIFTKEAEIPESVQRKADEAFARIRESAGTNRVKKETKGLRRMLRPMIAAAACAALAAGVCGATGIFRPLSGPEQGENAVLAAADRLFTLRVQAAELTPDRPVPLLTGGLSDAWILEETEEGNVSYCIPLPIICEGEGIESVSYRLNKGAIQVVEPEDSQSIIEDGELYDGELNTGIVGGDAGEDLAIRLYRSCTMSFDRQSDDRTWINIANAEAIPEEEQAVLFGEDASPEETAEAMGRLLDGVTITCTVQFADGTAQEAQIEVGSEAMTFGEAGEQAEDPQERAAFVTFALE
ncbi:MAG: hypothetical protein Q4C82_07920 [Eubacteriales bacterium]|nr:hypothetical protein [Eubacteriales bacterium]